MNRHNNATTTYYLLCQRHIRNGGELIKKTREVNITPHINNFIYDKKERSHSTNRDTSINGNHVVATLAGKAIPNKK